MMDDSVISILSEIRAEYNLFDPKDEPRYRALSMAIEALNYYCSQGDRIEDNLAGGAISYDYDGTVLRRCNDENN